MINNTTKKGAQLMKRTQKEQHVLFFPSDTADLIISSANVDSKTLQINSVLTLNAQTYYK